MIKKIKIFLLIFLYISFTENITEYGLIHYYNFDEEDNIIKDVISNNNGKISGEIIWVEGKLGKAIFFSKERNTRIKIPHTNSLNLRKISISVWIKTESATPGTIIEKWFSNSGIGWRIGYVPPKINFVIYSNKPFLDGKYYKDLYSNRVVNDGEWHNIVAVYNGSKAKLYIDGKEDNSIELNIDISSGNNADITIGYREYEGGTSFFNGIIDEVKIYKINLILTYQLSELIEKSYNILSNIKTSSTKKEIFENKVKDMEKCLKDKNEEKMEEYISISKEFLNELNKFAIESFLEDR